MHLLVVLAYYYLQRTMFLVANAIHDVNELRNSPEGTTKSRVRQTNEPANLIKTILRRKKLIPMALEYPNARLFIHGLLSREGLSGPEALAAGACEYGLISSEHILNVQARTDPWLCYCMVTAKNTVTKYFEHRVAPMDGTLVNAREAWSAIEREIQSRPSSETILCEPKNNRNFPVHDCFLSAPVLFDLMLQQIRRYP